jgi:hypothetical protein
MKERRKVKVISITAKEIEDKYGYTVEEQLKDHEEAEKEYDKLSKN